MLPSARFFLCALCRKQVLVCRRCDRGQLYCSSVCSEQRRAQRQREARARYASTRAGRRNNAERQRRYRACLREQCPPDSEKVTDQGSVPSGPTDKVVVDPSGASPAHNRYQPTNMRCHYCGQCCDPLLRADFLPVPQRRPRYATDPNDTIP